MDTFPLPSIFGSMIRDAASAVARSPAGVDICVTASGAGPAASEGAERSVARSSSVTAIGRESAMFMEAS